MIIYSDKMLRALSSRRYELEQLCKLSRNELVNALTFKQYEIYSRLGVIHSKSKRVLRLHINYRDNVEAYKTANVRYQAMLKSMPEGIAS